MTNPAWLSFGFVDVFTSVGLSSLRGQQNAVPHGARSLQAQSVAAARVRRRRHDIHVLARDGQEAERRGATRARALFVSKRNARFIPRAPVRWLLFHV